MKSKTRIDGTENVTIIDLTTQLRRQNNDLCHLAADEIEKLRGELKALKTRFAVLDKNFQEYGRSYEAQSKDLVRLYEEYRKVVSERSNQKDD